MLVGECNMISKEFSQFSSLHLKWNYNLIVASTRLLLGIRFFFSWDGTFMDRNSFYFSLSYEEDNKSKILIMDMCVRIIKRYWGRKKLLLFTKSSFVVPIQKKRKKKRKATLHHVVGVLSSRVNLMSASAMEGLQCSSLSDPWGDENEKKRKEKWGTFSTCRWLFPPCWDWKELCEAWKERRGERVYWRMDCCWMDW